MNFFQVFGLEPSFNINLDKLKEVYLEQQSKCHPDKFMNSDEATRDEALERSILLNKAYDTLKSDIDRAAYLLELNSEESVVDSPDILSAVFEDREQLESADSLGQLEGFLSSASEELSGYKTEFCAFYESHNFADASVAYKKMLYKNKFVQNIKNKINQLAVAR